MDELELRRRLLTDPQDNDAEVRDALRQDPEQARFAQELRQLDDALAKAMAIPVPDQLADRILVGHAFASHRQQQRRARWQLAMAASVAFAVGIGATLLWPKVHLPGGPVYLQAVPGGDLYAHAVGHYLNEANELGDIDEKLSFTQVNAKLETLGGDFTGPIGRIYFANFCDFDGVRSLHLILQGQNQRIAAFLVPAPLAEGGVRMVGDVKVVAIPQGKQTLMVVGAPSEPLEQVASEVESNLRWRSI